MPQDQRFSDRLAGAIDDAGTPLCVGIDPSPDRLPEALTQLTSDPAELMAAFCIGVVDAVAARGEQPHGDVRPALLHLFLRE